MVYGVKIFDLNRIALDAFRLGDLNEIPTEEIPPHDILCGGFHERNCSCISTTWDLQNKSG